MPLLATTRELYEELFGSPPKVATIHAGLECGIIGDAVGEIDILVDLFGYFTVGADTVP